MKLETRDWAHKTTKRHGFTLIELIVVMLIIAVLAGFILSAASSARKRSKATQAAAEVQALATGIRGYRVDYGQWPCPTPAVGGSWSNAPNDNSVVIAYLRPNGVGNTLRKSYWAGSGSAVDPFGSNYVITIDVTNNTVTVRSQTYGSSYQM